MAIHVSSGQIFSGITVSNDSMFISSGGVVSSITLNSGGYLCVYSGGVVESMTVNSGGRLYISSGGIVTDILANGGFLSRTTGASATFVPNTISGLVLSGRQSATICSGTTATDIKIINGSMYADGGVVYDTILSRGYFRAMYNAYVSNTAIYNNGYMYLGPREGSEHVVASHTVIYSGNQDIWYASSIDTEIFAGYQVMMNSGVAVRTILHSGTSARGGWGGMLASDFIVSSAASLSVSSNGTIDGGHILSGGSVLVKGAVLHGNIELGGLMLTSGAVSVAKNATIDLRINERTAEDGFLIDNLGQLTDIAISITVAADQATGTYKLAEGASSFNGVVTISNTLGSWDTISVGSTLEIGDLSCSLDLTDSLLSLIVADRDQRPPVPASDSAVKIYDGSMLVSAADVMTNKTLASGGSDYKMHVSSGGTANSTAITLNGVLQIYDGGTANSAAVDSGWLYVRSGGIANDAAVNSSGRFYIYSGGTANDAVVNSLGGMYLCGTANSTTVNSSGGIYVLREGAANNTVINGSGRMYLSKFGTANSTTVNSRGGMYVYDGGVANNTFVNSNGHFMISSGATANETVVNYYGVLSVCLGGSAVDAVVNSMGNLRVIGGTVINATVSSGGKLHILSRGTASNITLLSGGALYIFSGGSAVVENYHDGIVSAYNGATVKFLRAFISDGNTQLVSSGWQFENTVVEAGGELRVLANGKLTDATVQSGGYLVVNAGAAVSALTVQAGGYAEINGGVTVHGLSLGAGAELGGLSNTGSVAVMLKNYSNGIVSGKLENATLGGILSIADGTELKGLSGKFTLNIGDTAGNYAISGNDFSQVSLSLGGAGSVDLSGNYWGTTDIDAIYARLGVNSSTVRIDDVLGRNPGAARFALESTNLNKNYLASGQTSIDFVFNALLDESTVSADRITFVSAAGRPVAIQSVAVNGNVLTVNFDELTVEGVYNIRFADSIKDFDGNALSSVRNVDLEPGIGEQLRITARFSGAAVVKVAPAGDVAGTITAFHVYFGKSVDPALLLENVRLIAPNGTEIAPTSVRMVNDSTAEFTVPTQTANGKYSVLVSSGVTDYADNRLDQNGNGVGGEADDGFAATFNLTEIDLTIQDVQVPAELRPGNSTAVSWKVANLSGTALSGSWTDGVYLSTDAKWDIDDKLLAAYTHDNGLPAGETLSGNASIALPGVAEGSYYILVRSDIHHDEDSGVSAAEAAQNLAAIPVTVTVDTLTVGQATAGQASSSGDFAVYKFTQDAGRSMIVTLDTLVDAANMELFVGYGSAPTREKYDAKLQRITDGSITISDTMIRRDVYVMVYARSISGAVDYNVTAGNAPLAVDKVTQSSQDNSGAITLTVTGSNFTNRTAVSLIDADGNEYALSGVLLSGSSKLSTTIAADMLPDGDYTLKLTDETTAIRENAVSITGLGEGKLEYSFYAPSVVGRHANHTLSITVSNTGTSPIDAPLVFFTPTQSHANGSETRGAILSLKYDKNAFWVSTMPAGYSDALSFFVNGEGSVTIQPGESVNVPIYYTGWRSNDWDFGNSHINWNVSMLYAGDTTPLKWSDVFRNSGLASNTEEALAQAFSAEFGDTWGGYYEMVVGNLRYLNEIGASSSEKDTNSMLRFEAMQKTGSLQPFRTLTEAEDIVGDTISVSRSYAIGQKAFGGDGSFGCGWAFNWDVKLMTTSGGDVQIVQGGALRLYQPTATFNYQTVNGDGSVLKSNSAGHRLTDCDGSQWQFDTDGRLLYVIDTAGERISCTYDAEGRLSRLTNTRTGEYVIFTRDAATGQIAAVKDSSGKSVSYAYSEDGDLVSVVDSVRGQIAAYEYYASAEHTLTKATNGDAVTTYAYDELERLISVAGADGAIELSYGTAGEATLTSGDKQVTLYYAPDGNIAKIIDDVTGKAYTYTYDANGKFVSGKDPDGNALTARFVFAGREIDVRYEGADFSHLAFDAVYNTRRNTDHYVVDGITYYKTDGDGNILGQHDTVAEYYVAGYDANRKLVSYEYLKDGVTTTYTYHDDDSVSVTVDDPSKYFVIDGVKYFKKDMAGNVLPQSDTTTDSYTIGYDADGNRVFYASTRNGETTSYQYDANGLLTSMTTAEGTTSYTYDAAGNKATETAPDGSKYIFDADGNVTSVTDAAGHVTSYTYDANGNVASITSDGVTSLYDYDADGKLTGYTDERGNVYAYTYDADGRQNSVTVNGKTTSYTYDANGNYASITDPAGGTSFYEYDADSALTKFTDANGNSIAYTYGDDSILVKTTYADGTNESYVYDADGNPVSWTGRAGQTAEYTINADGYLTGVTYSDGKSLSYTYNVDGYVTTAYDIVFTYNADGDLTTMTFDDGRSVNYTYTPDGLVAGYADELGHGLNYTYTDDGLYDRLTDRSGTLVVDYDYDDYGRIVKATKGNGAYTTYAYDEYGQVTAIENCTAAGVLESFNRYTYDSEGRRTAMATQEGSWAYTYDVKDQLVGAVFTDKAGVITQDLAYTYDAMGNRLTATENGVTTTYTYNNLNQIVSANGFEYVYDANGNLLEDEKRTYTWTADNHVATETLKSTGQVWEYGYDAMGNRVSSTTDGVTTTWTVDTNGNVLAEYVNGAWNRTYYQGDLLAGFTDKDGNTYYFNNDALGTTVSVSGAAGTAVNSYSYDPWGNVLNSTEGVANDFEFVGGYGLMQNDSGTTFVRARNYAPETGRWISPDPIGIDGGENLYAYCGNGPTNSIDVDGNKTMQDAAVFWQLGIPSHIMLVLQYQGTSWGVSRQPMWDSSLDPMKDIYDHKRRWRLTFYYDKDIANDIYEYITSFKNNVLHRWIPFGYLGFGWCSLGVGDTLTAGGYKVKNGIDKDWLPDPFWEWLIDPNGDFLSQQVEKAESLGPGTGWYRSDGGFSLSGNYTFVYDPYPVINSITEKDKHIDKEGLHVTLSVEAHDPIGFNSDDGIVKYSWVELTKDASGELQVVCDADGNIEYDVHSNNTKQITVTAEQKVRYFGVSVTDKGGQRNENVVVVHEVAYDATAPTPHISSDKYSVSIDAGKSAKFKLTGKGYCFGGASVTDYKWIGASGDMKQNSSSITITVKAEKQSDGSIRYKWSDGFVGSLHTISLSVTDSNGFESLAPASVTLSVGSDISTSTDPNDKTVSEGFGEAGYVAAGAKLSYKIEFENDPEFATAPAQWVRVFDTLDAEKFDLDSFELQNFCIAGNFFTVGDGRDSFNDTVTLQIYDYTVTATVAINLVTDEDTGVTQLVAEFMAIDPETGFMLQDLVNGMLPVNDAIGAGEGYINYTINAQKNLAHGTEVTNTAKIYFDFNDPIDTPTTLNTIDAADPLAPTLAIAADGAAITLTLAGEDAGSGIAGYNVMYSTDGENFAVYGYTTYAELNIGGTSGTTYYFKAQAVDNVGNVSGWSEVKSVRISGAAPENLTGTQSGLAWDAVTGATGYVVEYSTDNFEHLVRLHTESNGVSSFCLPQGSYQWRVRTLESSEWVTGENIAADAAADAPQLIRSDADGNSDVFFANAGGKWGANYAAQHVGSVNDWSGTLESVALNSKNKLSDLFEGSTDANVLLLTDDANGDALFVDDIYTALPGTIAEQQARIARIDEIRAGVGDDVVDMTSRRFEYVGDGLTVRGGDGNDTIWANKGDNMLFGDNGNDRLVGASGNDVLVGGIGNDSMHGGGGNDIFAFCDNWGVDTVEQLFDGTVTLWFAYGDDANWNAATLTYADGASSVKVSGVSADKVSLKFGGDGSEQYTALTAQGAFADSSSEKIFEDKNKGLLATL